MSSISYHIKLERQTIVAFEEYVAHAEAQFAEQWNGGASSLWSDANPERSAKVYGGGAAVEMFSGDKPVDVAHGLVHDWMGAVYVPDTTVDNTLALLQDYNNHHRIYTEVIASKLVSRELDRFQIQLRLLKKKVMTVVLDTDHDVQYRAVRPDCWICQSRTTRIAEVDAPGLPNEKVLPPDTGHGFLWRLNSYWTIQQRGDGTVIECRALSLTRDIPATLKWFVQPIVRNLPRESLVATLETTKRALDKRTLKISAS